VQTSVAKRGVINDWLNDWFGGATAHQNFQSQWLLMAKIFHTYLNDYICRAGDRVVHGNANHAELSQYFSGI
jgi:hypothetical protein